MCVATGSQTCCAQVPTWWKFILSHETCSCCTICERGRTCPSASGRRGLAFLTRGECREGARLAFRLGFPVTAFMFNCWCAWKLLPAVNFRASGSLPSQTNGLHVYFRFCVCYTCCRFRFLAQNILDPPVRNAVIACGGWGMNQPASCKCK